MPTERRLLISRLCVCIHIHTYIYIYAYIYTNTYLYMQIYILIQSVHNWPYHFEVYLRSVIHGSMKNMEPQILVVMEAPTVSLVLKITSELDTGLLVGP